MSLRPITRRGLLIGGGVGAGLIVGYRLWPRASARLATAEGEHALSGFVKVGEDGHVAIVVPQVELGHGVLTGLAQIVADELGADWRQISVEQASGFGDVGLYANDLLRGEWHAGLGSAWLGTSLAPAMLTGGSTSVRAFEARLRDTGAAARALLCGAAAARWDADWETCQAHGGFVWFGKQELRFGELAREAARMTLPNNVAWRTDNEHRLTAQSLPRLDAPAKVDGSMTFAADVRLPDMAYAAIAEAPAGFVTAHGFDSARVKAMPGVLDVVVDADNWVAVVATNSFIAERGLAAGRPRWTMKDAPGDISIDRALKAAFADGTRIVATGDVGEAFRDANIWTQSYRVGMAAQAPLELASATARFERDLLEVWTCTQAPGLAQAAVARALSIASNRVIVHPTMVGGSFGARQDHRLAVQAAQLAQRLKRPVQLTRSRAVDLAATPPRPPAALRMAARTGPDGRIEAWLAKVATPSTLREVCARLYDGATPSEAVAAASGKSEPAAVDGSAPPYDIQNVAVDHHPAAIGIATGEWRGRAHVASVFARECFIDELAHMNGNDPFGYRMAMLGSNPRLAQCLTRAAASGNWQGGVGGSNQGLACHSMAGSHVAVLAEAVREGAGVRVTRLVAVADVGRVINPDIVRSQIIGGLVFGMSGATAAPLELTQGKLGPTRLADLRLPRMIDCPRIDVELIVSRNDPGGVGEIAVPPVAPAIAGALFAGSGVRYRQLPLLGPSA